MLGTEHLSKRNKFMKTQAPYFSYIQYKQEASYINVYSSHTYL